MADLAARASTFAAWLPLLPLEGEPPRDATFAFNAENAAWWLAAAFKTLDPSGEGTELWGWPARVTGLCLGLLADFNTILNRLGWQGIWERPDPLPGGVWSDPDPQDVGFFTFPVETAGAATRQHHPASRVRALPPGLVERFGRDAAALAAALAGSTAPTTPPPPPPDGPAPPNLFWWGGLPHELPPLPWRLVNHLWGRRHDEEGNVLTAVYGVNGAPLSGIRGPQRGLNGALLAEGIPVSVRCKNGRVTLDRP
jgi:hypothetical protein